MPPERPPLADPHSSAPTQISPIPRGKGIALLLLVALGCFAFACGIGILNSVIINGIEPLFSQRTRAIDSEAVVGGLLAAVFGCACCWGGFHTLRLAFGTQR